MLFRYDPNFRHRNITKFLPSFLFTDLPSYRNGTNDGSITKWGYSLRSVATALIGLVVIKRDKLATMDKIGGASNVITTKFMSVHVYIAVKYKAYILLTTNELVRTSKINAPLPNPLNGAWAEITFNLDDATNLLAPYTTDIRPKIIDTKNNSELSCPVIIDNKKFRWICQET